MTAACLVVLTWQDAFLASDLEIPDLSAVEEAVVQLSTLSNFEPAAFLADDIQTILDFYGLRGQADVDGETVMGMARASNRAMYEVEIMCRYLADGYVELAGALPDPTLIPLDTPGAVEAMRACRLWVSLYTDAPDDSREAWWAIALSNAEQAGGLNPDWEDLYVALLRLSVTGLEGFSSAFDPVSRQCQSVIQVPIRLRPSQP